MIVYLARDISPFVMYCVYGESGSSLLIESTDSMMHSIHIPRACIYMYIISVDVIHYEHTLH